MAPNAFQRKLAAILSADVKGYSRLMGEDENGTVRTLNAYRELMSDLIMKHRGRIVDSPGDNLLAEFGSVVDAVRCAVALQKELYARNAELAEDRRMEFRIGINLGDVIVEGDQIYGDGVNIAARVETLSEGGGICISGTVFDQVENKLALQWEYLGEQTVKNIKKPVRVYRVQMPSDETFPGPGGDLKLLDKPTVAVLPFVNISGDPEQEYFSDGITEDLITDLSKISGLFVIARHSVFAYKGKAVRVDQLGRELGVSHVLEGSVRKAGGRVRITAQLVDTLTGRHLWAERYDRDLKDIFALQDEVNQKIVQSLAVKLTKREEDRLAHKYTDDLEAYDLVLRGLDFYFRLTQEANLQAREVFQKVIDMEPQYALAHSRLGWTYLRDWSLGWTQGLDSLDRAFELAQGATALDDSLSDAHALLAETYLWKTQHDDAVTEAEKAIALDPNNAERMVDLGNILTWAGRPEEAIGWIKKAMRLNPICPVGYLFMLGHAYFVTERHGEAITTLKKAVDRQPDFFPAHLVLIASLWEAGPHEKLLAEVEEFKRLSPSVLPEAWKQLPYKDQNLAERAKRIFDAVRKAAGLGLK
jgi:adenylate cyclase